MSVSLPRSAAFTVLGWTAEDGRIFARYRCARHGDFTETFEFPVTHQALDAFTTGPSRGLIDILCVVAGVSYYKVGASPNVTFPRLSAPTRAMAEALYTQGLAEFFVRADLPYPPNLKFSGDIASVVREAPVTIRQGPAIVAFGGGKDSYVARSILIDAGEEITLASVTLSDAVKRVLTATAPEPVTFMDRRLDPQLAAATADGFNGHVPITAINKTMLSIFATMTGAAQVVFANERSADEPTIHLPNGVTANHQYSKSSAFEHLLHKAIARDAPAAAMPYSLLRPYSELWIARRFSQLQDAHARFTSCNRNFRLAGDATQRWCGTCAKCAFTSLIVSPFVDRERFAILFGKDFFDHAPLFESYKEVLGLSGHKPWDCVGTIDETQAAFAQTLKRPAWQSTKLALEVGPAFAAATAGRDLGAISDAALTPASVPYIPNAYLPELTR